MSKDKDPLEELEGPMTRVNKESKGSSLTSVVHII